MEPVLNTPAGEIPLHEYRLRLAGRGTVLHTGAILTRDDEARSLAGEGATPRPVGVFELEPPR